MPNEVSSADTVHALFVSAFPQQLTLGMLESPNVAIYVKDHVRNVYYELTDVRLASPHLTLYLPSFYQSELAEGTAVQTHNTFTYNVYNMMHKNTTTRHL